MWIPFQELPDTSRIWIFQAEKPLSQDDVSHLNPIIKSFIEDWTSHQATVRAGFDIQHNYFIIIAVDEAQVGASGCSIDKMFRFVQSMESTLGFSLLSKHRIALMKENSVNTYGLSELKNKLKNGEIDKGANYFDLMILDKLSLDKDWIKPISSGWLAKHTINN